MLMSKGQNNARATSLIIELFNKGMSYAEIGPKVGKDVSWASGVRTKGMGVSNETLNKLTALTGYKASPLQHDVTITKEDHAELILSLFNKQSTQLHKTYIMKKCTAHNLATATVERTLRELKSADKITCPKRGTFQLAPVKEKVTHVNNSKGTTDNKMIRRLIREVRSLKRLIKTNNKLPAI